MENRERVHWIDIAKFLGIFAIYLGHLGEAAGKAYPFVFTYHVPLFFFLSGCMDSYDKENKLTCYITKKFKSIMIPFWMFCFFSILVYVIQNNPEHGTIKNLLILVAKGNVRNSFFAGALWFLTCLFLMEVIFKIIKLIKKPWIIIAVCLLLFFVIAKVLSPPQWFYNLDSALYYIIYFAAGYVFYPYIMVLFQLNNRMKKVIFMITGIITFVYSALLFEGIDIVNIVLSRNIILFIFFPVIRALLVIWLNLVVARLLDNIELISEIGRETLYLCGNEYIIKTIVFCILGLFGLQFQLGGLSSYLYTFILLYVCVKVLIPCEKKIIAVALHNMKV